MFTSPINYNTKALLQKQIANDFAKFIPQANSILDLGCGTGFMAKALKKLNPDLIIEGVDISSEMLTKAQPFYNKIYKANIESFIPSRSYSLYISSMCLQWIEDIQNILLKYNNAPFYFAIPLPGSLKEITKCFKQIDCPSPIIKFKTPNLQPFEIKIYKQEFSSILDCLKHFSEIGAKKSLQFKLSHNMLKQAEKYFNNTITWEIGFFKK